MAPRRVKLVDPTLDLRVTIYRCAHNPAGGWRCTHTATARTPEDVALLTSAGWDVTVSGQWCPVHSAIPEAITDRTPTRPTLVLA